MNNNQSLRQVQDVRGAGLQGELHDPTRRADERDRVQSPDRQAPAHGGETLLGPLP